MLRVLPGLLCIFGILGATLTTVVSFKPGPAAVGTSSLVASPNAVVADGNTAMVVTLRVRDAYSNPLPSFAVTLAASGGNTTLTPASGSTDGNGTFVSSVVSTQAQSQNVTVSLAAGSLSAAVQFVPGAASAVTSNLAVSPNAQIANNSNSIVATLTLLDAKGNPIAGQSATFSASGSSTTVTAAAAATSSAGTLTASYQTLVAQNQNAQVAAGGISLLTPMAFVAGPVVASGSSLLVNPNILAGNANVSASVTATARDAQGNLASGVGVSLTASGGNTTFGSATGTTSASGQYSTTVSSTQMQSETLVATFTGNANVSTSVTFTGPASATTSTLVVNPNSRAAGDTNTLVATLTLRDASSNALANVATTWAAPSSAAIASQTSSTTAAGISTASYKFTSTTAQSQNVQVTAGGANVLAPVSIVAASPNSLYSTFTLSPPLRQLANNSNQIIGQILVRDIYQNAVSGVSLSWVSSSSTISMSVAATTGGTGYGNGYFSTSVPQNANISVSATGLSFTGQVIFTATPSKCVLSASPNNQTADGNSPITLTAAVYDANSNAVANSAVYFSTSGGANAFSPVTAITNTQGIATSIVQSMYAGFNMFSARTQSLQCVAQGNFVGRTPWCTGSPNFVLSTIAVGQKPVVCAADINQDGNQDLVVASYTAATVTVLLGHGNGTFTAKTSMATGSGPGWVTAADVNSDGWLDLLVSNYASNSVSVFLNAGNNQATFLNPNAYPLGVGPGVSIVTDINFDGLPDVLNANWGRGLGIALNVGGGVLSPQNRPSTGVDLLGIALGDFNRDGIADIVTTGLAGSGNSPVVVMLGTNASTFGSPKPVTIGTAYNQTTGVAVGDFNGDGNQDLAVPANGGSQILVLLGAGNGNFAAPIAYNTANKPSFAILGDFNGDSNADICINSYSQQAISLSMGNGAAVFNSNVTFLGDPNFAITLVTPVSNIAVADFNNDGRPDIVAPTVSALDLFVSSGCH